MLLESKIQKFLDANIVIDKKISKAENSIEYHKKAIEKQKNQIGILQKEKDLNIRKIAELKTRIIQEQTGIDLANVNIDRLLNLMKNNKQELLIDSDTEKDIEDININTNIKENFTNDSQPLSNIGEIKNETIHS